MDKFIVWALCLLGASLNGGVSAQQLQVDVVPREQVIKEGEPLQFLCRVGIAIETCRIELPSGRGLSLRPNQQANNLGIQYAGEGFQAGQCGIRIDRTTAEHNGVFKCSMAVPNSFEEAQGRMLLTVARPPQAPEMILHGRYAEYNEGETLEATCRVRNGRPPANITWMIGDEHVVSGLAQPLVTQERHDMDLFTVTQNLTRTVTWRDHGKKLRCIAQHVGSEGRDQETEADIQVRFGPQPSKTSTIDQYGFTEGVEGVIRVEVAANPQPRLQWKVNGQELIEGERTGEYEADLATQLESGRWEARLRINKVSPSDIDKDFRLTASNDIGSQTYNVKISTQPGEMGNDLGTASIVGIVVAVLVLFLIILVVCFARVTGRWCFAAGIPMRSDKESGGALHSSDTESADRAPAAAANTKDESSRKARFNVKMPAIFSKGKTAAKQTPLDEVKTVPVDEPKQQKNAGVGGGDSVVYAELDLGSGRKTEVPKIRPEDDKTEYAEIIHTKQI